VQFLTIRIHCPDFSVYCLSTDVVENGDYGWFGSGYCLIAGVLEYHALSVIVLVIHRAFHLCYSPYIHQCCCLVGQECSVVASTWTTLTHVFFNFCFYNVLGLNNDKATSVTVQFSL
jgi:hypothetical protein